MLFVSRGLEIKIKVFFLSRRDVCACMHACMYVQTECEGLVVHENGKETPIMVHQAAKAKNDEHMRLERSIPIKDRPSVFFRTLLLDVS